MDLGFQGPAFTWSNLRKGYANIRERIDRAFANPSWRQLYPEAIIFHLARTHSDHPPNLINCSGNLPPPTLKPFRFEFAWTTHEDIESVIRHAWIPNGTSISHSVNNLTQCLKEWNQNHFGNIFRNKRKLFAKISGVQKRLCHSQTTFLVNLEKDLVFEYNKILHQEELLWFQKSRVNWLALGERNTKFYHLTALKRRRRNKISTLKLDGEECGTNSEDIKVHVQEYFKNLFTGAGVRDLSGFNDSLCRKISDQDRLDLCRPVSLEETIYALKSMKPDKAPGPDGYQALFFQKYWEIVGSDVHNFVVDAFENGEFSEDLNATFISLIPNVENPERVTQFRPISLCNVIYKILAKVLVGRIRPLLGSIMSPLQRSFVPGRHTTDNIFIAQELLHFIKKSKAKEKGMVWKEQLCCLYDEVTRPSKLTANADFHLFKAGVEPKWEDPECANGGKWTALSSKKAALDTMWLETVAYGFDRRTIQSS